MPASVTGQRPVLGGGRLGRLLRGQQGESVVRTLGNVFTLCAHAHRRTARLALHAACPQASAVLPVEPPELLRLETARDHLRSMALDWPQRQPSATYLSPDLHWLRDCPLPLYPPHRPVRRKKPEPLWRNCVIGWSACCTIGCKTG